MTIAIYFNSAYSISAVKQMAAGFDDLFVSRRTHRPQPSAVFLRPYNALVRLLWADIRLEYLRVRWFPRTPVRQSDRTCPPTSFDDGERVNNPVLGGHNMATTSIFARPEQTQSPVFNLAARAARKAARQWFAGIPTQSLAEWRDTCRLTHCDGLPNPKERGSAFDTAFACEIGSLIIAGGRSNE